MSKIVENYLYIIQEDISNLDEFIVLPTIALISAIYKRYLSKAAKACRGKSSLQRKLCVVSYKMMGRKTQISKIKQSTKDCSQQKNPKKCQEKMKNQILKYNEDVIKLSNQFKSIKAKGESK